MYRGTIKGKFAGEGYARDVEEACFISKSKGKGVAAFMCESILGCAG